MNIFVHENIYIRSHTKPEARGDIWLLHGLGESGLCFREAFTLLKDVPYNLYAPDFPGFGASSPRKGCQSIAALVEIMQETISDISQNQGIHLVGHSMSGIVATELIHSRGANFAKSFVNIEGTIVVPFEIAERLTSLSPENSIQQTVDVFYDQALSSPTILRYIASLNFMDPKTLYNFARETYEYSGKDKSGARYLDIKIPKLYIYGRQSWTGKTVEFLKAHDMKTYGADGGHWSMVDSPKDCYSAILNFIQDGSQ